MNSCTETSSHTKAMDDIREALLISEAITILENRAKYTENLVVTSPDDTKNFLRLKLGSLEHEVFSVMFLDNRHQLIEYKELFRGTIDGASVYPREVVKEALQLNAAALIIAHNHPSGVCEPSSADESMTRRVKEACSLMDIRLLDHLVVSGESSVSFAERGLL